MYKNYLARPLCRHPAHLVVDVPEQCCGVCLSTLTRRGSTDAYPEQPNLYNATYCDLARDCCLVGATDEVLADYFGVTHRTIQNWIATHPDFADAVRKGRIVADAKVARAPF